MSQITLTERVRCLIHQELTRVAPDSGSPIETLLIRDGLYCGRRFMLGEHQAVWFIEEDQVKLYGAEGQVLSTYCASQIAASERAEQLTRAA